MITEEIKIQENQEIQENKKIESELKNQSKLKRSEDEKNLLGLKSKDGIDYVLVDTNKEAPCEGLKLNIGSGFDYKKNHINIDKYDTTADANWDVEHLPLNPRTVAQIIATDFLEHLSHNQVIPVLREMARVLKPEGRLILIVPDIVGICDQVVKDSSNEWNLARLYGHQAHEGQFHKTGFTSDRLFKFLGFSGFNRTILAYYAAIDGTKKIYCEAYKY